MRILELSPADESLLSALESLLLVAPEPVSIRLLAGTLEESQSRVEALLDRLAMTLNRGIRLQRHQSAAQLVTAPENAEVVQRFLGGAKQPALSRSALEAVSVVAYRQPVTRGEVESIRGVNSDRALQALEARGLIEERGRRAVLGRPIEYGTTFEFLEYFGLASLTDLPPVEADEEKLRAEQLGLRAVK